MGSVQVCGEKCRLVGRAFDGGVINLQNQFDVARWCGLVFHTQAENDGRETRVPPETQELGVAENSIADRHPAINTSYESCVLSGVGHTVLHIVTGIHSIRYPTCLKKGNSISE